MPDRYKVEDISKTPPEQVWGGMAMSAYEAMTAASMEKGIPVKNLVAEVIPDAKPPQSPAKVRKTRADAGQKRSKVEKPKKRRTLYHLVKGEVTTFGSKEELDKELGFQDDFSKIKIIEGGSVHNVECQKTWRLV